MNKDDLREEAGKAGKRAEESAREFAHDVKAKSGDLADQASEKAQALYEDARERVGQAADDGREFLNQARERGERYYRDHRGDIADYVEEQPIAALLIAGAVGFGIAWLLLSPRR